MQLQSVEPLPGSLIILVFLHSAVLLPSAVIPALAVLENLLDDPVDSGVATDCLALRVDQDHSKHLYVASWLIWYSSVVWIEDDDWRTHSGPASSNSACRRAPRPRSGEISEALCVHLSVPQSQLSARIVLLPRIQISGAFQQKGKANSGLVSRACVRAQSSKPLILMGQRGRGDQH